MSRKAKRTHFPVSLFATPNPRYEDIFYTVPRAGHMVGGADHRIVRDHFPGHELILCLRGCGYVRVGGRTHEVRPHELVWVNCHHPHEHGAVQSDPWEVYWIRVEGFNLARMCDILSVSAGPVFGSLDHEQAARLYEAIFEVLPSEEPEAAARVHALVAQLLALIFAARQHRQDAAETPPPALRKAIEQMKLFYFQPVRVEQLARLCGMSNSHFARRFKAAFGTSPIDWLRRERINQAKKRLAGTDDRIEEIASQVGYRDRFFFSKDFKQMTGHSPREFRRLEGSGSEG